MHRKTQNRRLSRSKVAAALEALPADEPPHELESLLGGGLWHLVPPALDRDEGEVVGRVALRPQNEGAWEPFVLVIASVTGGPPGSIG